MVVAGGADHDSGHRGADARRCGAWAAVRFTSRPNRPQPARLQFVSRASLKFGGRWNELIQIPATAFAVMGDNLGERPQHEVTLDAFMIDRFEVTNQQYQQYLLATGVKRACWLEWYGISRRTDWRFSLSSM